MSVIGRGAICAFAAGLACSTLWGCAPETRYKALSFLFDGVPKPGEEEPEEKRPPPRRPAAAPTQPQPPTEPSPPAAEPPLLAVERSMRWEKIGPLLPKDAQGEVDWTAALNNGTIRPRSGLDPKEPELQPLALDFTLVPEGMPEFETVFRHTTHTRWMGCDTCHPEIFEMRKGADTLTMEMIYAGKACGVCHGTVAFAVEPNCAVCHPRAQGDS
jgi:c(7)-type cytochrome triheme protein